MAYVHMICKPNELSRIDVEDDVSVFNDFEIMQMLNDINDAKNRPIGFREKHPIGDDWKHIKLKRFFANSTSASITLTFKQVEEIDGQALPPTAWKCSSYWYSRMTCNTIAEAWNTESYQLVKLDMKKGSARFQRRREGLVHIQLPHWLAEEKIPEDARSELQNYFEHIKKKYGL